MQIEARKKGISGKYRRALNGLSPDPDVARLAARQPEYVKPIWAYLDHVITEQRLYQGRLELKNYATFLDGLEKKYGVPREIIVAIWGVETSYGENKGSFPVLQALATLGYDGKRADFGRQQLLAALEILQSGHVKLADFKGSWAGAMGHTQFIPTTYLGYSADGTGDNIRNIWTEPRDALASTAYYLKRMKWRRGLTWGVEVKVGRKFKFSVGGLKKYKSPAYWQKRGVKTVSGKNYGELGELAFYAPAGMRGPLFLLTRNFASLLRYNTAPAYALAVAHLADKFTQPRRRFWRDWPLSDRPLRTDEIRILQMRLQNAGYGTGGIDGVLGRLTRAAVFQFQRNRGFVADGYATPGLLTALKSAAR